MDPWQQLGSLCFNPCFRGTCSWWFDMFTPFTHQIGFNPCFRGTCSWCIEEGDLENLRIEVSILVFVELALDVDDNFLHWLLHLTFQSLFSWNLLLMGNISTLKSPIFIVSILVFVELALDALPPRHGKSQIICFNPCFRGTCSWWHSRYHFQNRELQVSILVFVELALDGKILLLVQE